MIDCDIRNYKTPESRVVELILSREVLVISNNIPDFTETDTEEDVF